MRGAAPRAKATGSAREVAAAGVPVTTIVASALVNNALASNRSAYLRGHRENIRALRGDGGPAAAQAMDTTGWEVVLEASVRRVIAASHDAGVPLVVGTDSHHSTLPGGDAGLDEMDILVAAGLTPYEALRAATIVAAEVLGRRGGGAPERRGRGKGAPRRARASSAAPRTMLCFEQFGGDRVRRDL